MLRARRPAQLAALIFALPLAPPLIQAQTPTIQISEFSLASEASPGEEPLIQGTSIRIDATTQVVNGLAGLRARLYARQVFENGTALETQVGLSPSAAFDGDREFLFQNRGLDLARVCDPSLECPGPTLAGSITKLVRLELFAILGYGNEDEVARSPERVIPAPTPFALTSVTPASQPLNAEQRIRITTTGTRFTQLVFPFHANLQFRHSNDSQRLWSVPFFAGQNFPCAGLDFEACDSTVINDTTLEFTMKTFAEPGDLVFGSPAESLPGTYDLWLAWTTSAGQHDIVSLASWVLGDAPAGPPAQAPMVTGLSPESVASGGGSFSLTVNGAGFQDGAVVLWEPVSPFPALRAGVVRQEQALPTEFMGSTRLIAQVPSNLVAKPGAADISARNPGGPTSSPVRFHIVAEDNFIELSELQVESGGETFTFAAGGEHELARPDVAVTQFSVRAKIRYLLSLPQASLWIQAFDSNTGDLFGLPQSLGALNDTNGFDLETVTPPAVYNYAADGTQISFQLFFRAPGAGGQEGETFAESNSISVTVKTLGPGDRKPPPPITMRSLLPKDSEPKFMTARGRLVAYDSFVGFPEESRRSCEFEPRRVTLQVGASRFLGPTNAQGFLQNPQALIQEQMVAPMARLRIAAYDVDSEFQQTGNLNPERDVVRINGFPVQNTDGTSWLKGADNQWRVTEFLVPIEQIKLPSAPGSQPRMPPVAATNEVQIDIDTANSDPKWCTSVDWAMLSVAGMAPLMLVHGTNADSSTWEFHIGNLDSPVQLLTNRGIPFGHPIDLVGDSTPETNAVVLQQQVKQHADRFGAGSVHLVAHSKGATDSRWMLSHRKEQLSFAVLSLFSIGTPSRGTVLSDLAIAVDSSILTIDPAIFDAAIGTLLGQNILRVTPMDPARTVQQPANMRTLNDQLNPRKPPEIPYFSIAGNADQNRNQVIDQRPEWDGVFEGDRDWTETADELYQVLRRVRSIRVVNGPIADTIAGTPTTQFEPNDLVSTVNSTHCTECGFEPLGTFNLNHTALRNPEIIELIIETIKKEFPLPK